MAQTYYVSPAGYDRNEGTETHPFRTISKAASAAQPGDTVIVGEGVYREWVDPLQGGLSDSQRITYEAAPGEHPVIKGSEVIKGWMRVEGNVWKAVLPISFFGDFNPYTDLIHGDWLEKPGNYILHTGEVYLNGKSFYEVQSLEGVLHPVKRETGYNVGWNEKQEYIADPEGTVFTWYTETDETQTVIWANFGGADPNEETVEINVRRACFYPTVRGRNYITLKGFEIAQAACPFAPPTGDQIAMVGAHWSKGWIIEDCDLHDAKCCALSIGTDAGTGNNPFTKTHKKPGYTYQNEAVCRALQQGWSRETVGSHVIRNNVIHDCGQNGIVGHLGCIFSEIYGNEIYHIATKHEFFGYEIGAIKLHAAIDTIIRKNYMHDNSLGIWLDWQAQGTRISSNLFVENDRDLMVEVTHGPYIVDNNIFTSAYTLENTAQGGAYFHNLFSGGIKHTIVPDRSTPYHFAHTTQLMGTSFVYGGDDRLYQNIFLGPQEAEKENFLPGTGWYSGSPVSMEEYTKNIVDSIKGDDDENLYTMNRQAVYIDRNVYLGGASSFDREETKVISDETGSLQIERTQDAVYLLLTLPEEVSAMPTKIYQTSELQPARSCDCGYENPDGTPICFDTDYNGVQRAQQPAAGPLEALKAGVNRICVWKK